MFDFEKLIVYKKATELNLKIYSLLARCPALDKCYKDQLRRAAFSIPLNIAEGTGRVSKPDRRNFYVIARGSAFECVAIVDQLLKMNLIEKEKQMEIYSIAFEVTKMLFGLEKSLKTEA